MSGTDVQLACGASPATLQVRSTRPLVAQAPCASSLTFGDVRTPCGVHVQRLVAKRATVQLRGAPLTVRAVYAERVDVNTGACHVR